ncbi:MAG: class I SAM-dependent methyltransferase [Bacteroidia bacterium]|nr:class I SAM-dependent methyltransferase [Bacteroidia bacterium]
MKPDFYKSTYTLFYEAFPQTKPHILELACGPGNITQFLFRRRPYFNLLATDYAPVPLELAAKNNPTAECRILDPKKWES